jgi:non-heme chloroperoxidase
MPTPKIPAMYIHGLWLHATSWQPWIELFEEAGYEATRTAA